MWTRSRIYNSMRIFTCHICTCLVCAGAGVVVDIDHVLAKPLGLNGRFLHKAFGILGIVLVIGGIGFLLASIRRYKQTRILRRIDGYN